MTKEKLIARVAELEAEQRKMQLLMCSDIVEARLVKPDTNRDPLGLGEMQWHLVLEGIDEEGDPISGIACVNVKDVRFAG